MKRNVQRQQNDTETKFSLRYLISYKGSEFRLVSVKSIAMIPPIRDDLSLVQFSCGSWIELRSAGEETLYGRIIHDLLEDQVEVPTGRLGEELAWQNVSDLEKMIVLLVPDLKDADHLVINNRGEDGLKSETVEIARFPVTFENIK